MPIKYSVKECIRMAAEPTEVTQQRLKRVARWLLLYGRCIIRFKWPKMQSVVKVKVDTDEEWGLLAPRKFTLHLFVEENTLYRKVRVAPAT